MGALWDPKAKVYSVLQEAAYHPEVAPDVRLRALHFGRECANGYLELLDHVLLVRRRRLLLTRPPCTHGPQGLHANLRCLLLTAASLHTRARPCTLTFGSDLLPAPPSVPESVLVSMSPFRWGCIGLSIIGSPTHLLLSSCLLSSCLTAPPLPHHLFLLLISSYWLLVSR